MEIFEKAQSAGLDLATTNSEVTNLRAEAASSVQ